MGLGRFLLRRLVTFIPTVIGVLFVTYLIAYVIPADPVRAWVGEKLMNREALEEIRVKYKFNAPWYEQFAFMVTSLMTGNLEDPVQHKNVFDELFYRFPITVEVAMIGFLFTVVIGIPLGFIAALRKDTVIDFFVRILALIGSSLPPFVLYYFLILFLFTYTHTTVLAGIPFPSQACSITLLNLPNRIPVLGHVASTIGSIPMFGAAMCGEWGVVADTFRRLYLPGLALGLLNGGLIARIVRNSLLDSLSQEYIQYAKARGLKKTRIWMHALRSAAIPVVTILGTLFGGLLSGALIAETVFNIPGIGRYMYDAIARLNFPAIVGGTFLVAVIFVTVNLIVDIIYAILDPRIRY